MPPVPSRYQPLADYLAAQTGDVVRLTFAEIEAIIGGPLPLSAYARGWWTNSAAQRSHVRAWLAAGWRSEKIRPREEVVTFVRLLPDVVP